MIPRIGSMTCEVASTRSHHYVCKIHGRDMCVRMKNVEPKVQRIVAMMQSKLVPGIKTDVLLSTHGR